MQGGPLYASTISGPLGAWVGVAIPDWTYIMIICTVLGGMVRAASHLLTVHPVPLTAAAADKVLGMVAFVSRTTVAERAPAAVAWGSSSGISKGIKRCVAGDADERI